jgi:hypothetical protein
MHLAPTVASDTDPLSALVVCARLPGGTRDSSMPGPFSYLPVRSRDATLLPLEDNRHWNTSLLVAAAEPSSNLIKSRQGGWELREFSQAEFSEEVCDDRAPDIRFATLLVGGPRQFELFGRRWHCSLAWLPFEKDDWAGQFSTDTPHVSLHSIRRAAGCLFARTLHYDEEGREAGYRTLVLAAETSLLHGPPDALYVQLWAHLAYHAEPTLKVLLPSFLVHQRSQILKAYWQAESAFDRYCSPEPIADPAHPDLVDTDQRELFLAKISNLDWEEALGEVEEAWQLTLACRLLQPPDFAHRRTQYKRARAMIEAYCSKHAERAAEIRVLWLEAGPALLSEQNS